MSRLDTLTACLATSAPVRAIGRIAAIDRAGLRVAGLGGIAGMGDRVSAGGRPGRVVAMTGDAVTVGLDDLTGLAVGDTVVHLGPDRIAPTPDCLGRVIDASGKALDGRPLLPGGSSVKLASLGPRGGPAAASAPLVTGIGAIDLLAPLSSGACIRLRSEDGIGVAPFVARLAERGSPDVVIWSTRGTLTEVSRVARRIGGAALSRSVVVLGPMSEAGCGALAAMAIAIDFARNGRAVAVVAEGTSSAPDALTARLCAIAESYGIAFVAVEHVGGDAVRDPAPDDRFDATFLATSAAAQAGLMPPIEPADGTRPPEDVRAIAARALSRQIRRGEKGDVLDFFRDIQGSRDLDMTAAVGRLDELLAGVLKSAEAPNAEGTGQRSP